MNLVYLDYAATTPLAKASAEAMNAYEAAGRGNALRGGHPLAVLATAELARARKAVAEFVGGPAERLVFTKSTTESLNMLAHSLAAELKPGDEVLITAFEHHANLLPWRVLSRRYGFSVLIAPRTNEGWLDVRIALSMIGPRTKVVAMPLVSNVLGTILPVADLARVAHQHGAMMIVDAAQAVGHLPVSLADLGADAVAFGAHKMYGPSGIGALAYSADLAPRLKPLIYGGGMVDDVTDTGEVWATDQRLLEAGSPNVTGAIGFAAACDYLQGLGLPKIATEERFLTEELIDMLAALSFTRQFGTPDNYERTGIASFVVMGVHPHDVAEVLAEEGLCVRAGMHCAAPLTRSLDPQGTVRVSLGLGNGSADIARLREGLMTVKEKLL